MVLTRDFRKTVQARTKRNPAYREAMLTEAVDSFLSGDVEVGKAILRDYINATIGFEALSRQLDKPSKSLHRMLSPSGNPKTNNFFEILRAVRVAFTVFCQQVDCDEGSVVVAALRRLPNSL
jgi:DNA-binding phage protein